MSDTMVVDSSADPAGSDRLRTTAVAIVLAAGKGVRAGADLPKQLRPLAGSPVLVHALAQHTRLGHHVIVVVSEDLRPTIEQIVDRHLPGREMTIVNGGSTRRESVLAGIDAVPDDCSDAAPVILRNAASPNTPDLVVADCVTGIDHHDGMQAFVASEATTFTRDGDLLDKMILRDITGFTVDPTVYRRGLIDRIADVMRQGDSGETTLDIARRLGAVIGLVASPRTNIKITTPEDFDRLVEIMELGRY